MTENVDIVARGTDLASGPLSGIRRVLANLQNDVKGGILAGIGLGAGISAFNLVQGAIHHVTDEIGTAVKAAEQAQVSTAALTTALQANDKGWSGNLDAIDKVITAREALGFTGEEQRKSLAVLVAMTKDHTAALLIERVAMDLSRLKGIDLATSSLLLGKAYEGNFTALKKMGIEIPKGTKGMEALAIVQARVSGQADAFAKTTAGQSAALNAEMEGLQEEIGAKLLPIMNALMGFVAKDVIPGFKNVMGAVGGTIDVLSKLGPVTDIIKTVLEALGLLIGVKLVANLAAGAIGFLGFGATATGALDAVSAATNANTGATDLNTGAVSLNADAVDGATIGLEGATVAVDADTVATDLNTISTRAAAVGQLNLGLAGEASVPGLAAATGGATALGIALAGIVASSAAVLLVIWAVGQAAKGQTKELQNNLATNEALQKVADRTGVSLGYMQEEFQRLVAAGSTTDDALKQLTATNFELGHSQDEAGAAARIMASDTGFAANIIGDSWDKITEFGKVGVFDSVQSVKHMGDQWIAEIKGHKDVFANSLAELADLIPAELKNPIYKAVAMVGLLPGQLAAALLAGENALKTAASALAAAATDKLQIKINIADTRKQLADQLTVMKQAGSKITDQQRVTLTTLQLQLAGYLLEADPKSKEAANLLAKYLKSADPATRDAAAAMMKAAQDVIEQRIPRVRQIMQQTGKLLKDAYDQYRAETAAAAAAQADAAVRALIAAHPRFMEAGRQAGAGYGGGLLEQKPVVIADSTNLATAAREHLWFNAYDGGASSAQTFLNGIINTIWGGIAPSSFLGMALAALRQHFGGSLPTRGPLVNIQTGAKSIAQAFMGTLAGTLGGFTMPNLMSRGSLAMPGLASRGQLAYAGAGGGDIHLHIHSEFAPTTAQLKEYARLRLPELWREARRQRLVT